jgi:hypothetical protein
VANARSAHSSTRRTASAAEGALAVRAAACPRKTGARSVRPSRGRRFVKTCKRDHGGFLRARSPGRCSKAANRRRTSMGAATSGWIPDPAWCWLSFSGRKPRVGSSAPPAGGHLVHGEAPGRLVKRAAGRGADARKSAEPVRVACAPCPGRTTDGRRSSRRAARALRRARLAREGRRCVPLHDSRTASAWLPRAVHSSTLTSLSGGVCQLPLGAPWARGKTFAHRRSTRHA